MIPFRTSANSSVSLGRRRGTTSTPGSPWMILSSRALFLLAALCASIFTMGLLVGTHVVVVKKSTPGVTTTGATASDPAAKALRGLDVNDKVVLPKPNNNKKSAHILKDIIEQSQLAKEEDKIGKDDDDDVDDYAKKLNDAETDLDVHDKPQTEKENKDDYTENLNDEEKEEEEEEENTEAEEIEKIEKELEENLPEYKEQLEKEQKSKEESEMQALLDTHKEQLEKHMPDILSEEVKEEDHPHLRNPYKQIEKQQQVKAHEPQNLQSVDPSSYYLFSTNQPGKSIWSATIDFAAQNNDNGVAFSTWIYLGKKDMGNDMDSRTILSSSTLSCKNDADKLSSFVGWNLYVNSPNTSDEQLILQYATYNRMNNQAYPVCHTLAATGYQIPIETWTFVAVTYHPSSGMKLFMNGEVVAEDTNSDFYPSSAGAAAQKTMIGLSAQNQALSLEGNIAMMMLFSNVNFLEKDVILLYEAGIDLALVTATGTLLQNRYSVSQNYFYPLTANDELTIKEEYYKVSNGVVQTAPTPNPQVKRLNEEQYKEEELKFKVEIANYSPLGGGRYSDHKNGDNLVVPQNEHEKQASDDLARVRRHHVRNAMKHAWEGYRKYSWGKDELLPQSKSGHNNWGGMGTTLVDSLDTLWLMGMKDEFWEARDWVKDHLTCDRTGSVSVFETTIRSLGGLLSAYDWSGDQIFLEKAQDLGQRLIHAFDDSSGLPKGQTVLNGHSSNNAGWLGDTVLLAEVGTVQVEFRYLSEVIQNEGYAKKVNKVFDILADMNPNDGLYPYGIRTARSKLSFSNSVVTFGAMSDSFYEYLLKCWLQGGKKETKLRQMYDKAMDGVHNQLLFTTKPDGLTYIADKNGASVNHKMDHLACFMAGSLALGAYTHPDGLESEKAQRDLKTGKALAYTCYQMYARMKTGISAEAVRFSEGGTDITANPPFYILRPETLESFFILNFLTGDPTYREWGWEIFQSIEKYCRTDVAYGGLKNVNRIDDPENKMESFFLAETLKYAYLLQDPDTEVDILNKHVFNTEAHPTRIFPELKKANVIS